MNAMNGALPHPIRFGREVCGVLPEAERREWWLGNGLGGYAAGTVAGTLTRRYHGLLVAPVHPPLGRVLVFARAEATLADGGREVPLFTNRWGDGALEPRGDVHLEAFELEGRMPVWTFAVGDRRLEYRVWMEPGANTTYLAYRLDAPPDAPPAALRVKLLVNARDHHGSTRPWDFNPVLEADGERLRVTVPGAYTLWLRAPGGSVATRHDWIENFALTAEQERGLPDRDAHLCVGEAQPRLTPGKWCGIVASLDADASPYLEEAMRRFRAHDLGTLARARCVVPEVASAPEWVQRLVLAADSFVFARPLPGLPEGESVIAGYPWFGDWGRDTMIALPGIAIATGRYASARRILETFARFVDRGMLPNVFPGAGEKPDYNTVDAALWYIEAWRAYVEASGDLDAARAAFPVLKDVVDWHVKGTRYGIGVDPADGLLRAGEAGVQLTWMDAKVGDWVVTPRIGKPVEINALWFNALAAMAALAGRIGEDAQPFTDLAQRAAASFARFVTPDGKGLYDVIDGPAGDDATMRPNQILAVSLPHSPLSAELQARVVALVGRELLTSYGLRSLDPAHPDFRGHYTGDVWERDGSYHQGPVWAWLLGHYALAHFRVHGDAAAAQRLLEPVRDHLADAALGSVSEIFDGAAPHTPRGAPCQAWSVACTLEAWWRLEKARRAAERPESHLSHAVAAVMNRQGR
ncbi:MAG: amylo-alpha-1,6-glucosidase [Pseudomonadota bacterium]